MGFSTEPVAILTAGAALITAAIALTAEQKRPKLRTEVLRKSIDPLVRFWRVTSPPRMHGPLVREERLAIAEAMETWYVEDGIYLRTRTRTRTRTVITLVRENPLASQPAELNPPFQWAAFAFTPTTGQEKEQTLACVGTPPSRGSALGGQVGHGGVPLAPPAAESDAG